MDNNQINIDPQKLIKIMGAEISNLKMEVLMLRAALEQLQEPEKEEESDG